MVLSAIEPGANGMADADVKMPDPTKIAYVAIIRIVRGIDVILIR